MITFENDIYRCSKDNSGSTSIVIKKDEIKYSGVDLTGCILYTTPEGFIEDKLTPDVIKKIRELNPRLKEGSYELLIYKMDLRNRHMNKLIGFIFTEFEKECTNG